jgi:hypothetical protein
MGSYLLVNYRESRFRGKSILAGSGTVTALIAANSLPGSCKIGNQRRQF